MLLLLALGTYFGTCVGSLVVASLDTLGGLIIGTVEGYLVGLSLGLPLGPPPEFSNAGAVIGSFS